MGPPAANFARTIDPANYHLGWNFERVDQDKHGVRVQFSGGRVEHADILVGGDGIRSSVRAQMAPEVQPVYAGYYIWRGAPTKPTSRRKRSTASIRCSPSICRKRSR